MNNGTQICDKSNGKRQTIIRLLNYKCPMNPLMISHRTWYVIAQYTNGYVWHHRYSIRLIHDRYTIDIKSATEWAKFGGSMCTGLNRGLDNPGITWTETSQEIWQNIENELYKTPWPFHTQAMLWWCPGLLAIVDDVRVNEEYSYVRKHHNNYQEKNCHVKRTWHELTEELHVVQYCSKENKGMKIYL